MYYPILVLKPYFYFSRFTVNLQHLIFCKFLPLSSGKISLPFSICSEISYRVFFYIFGQILGQCGQRIRCLIILLLLYYKVYNTCWEIYVRFIMAIHLVVLLLSLYSFRTEQILHFMKV